MVEIDHFPNEEEGSVVRYGVGKLAREGVRGEGVESSLDAE